MERYSIRSAYDGLNIGFAVARPQTAPKAVLQLVHGMCGCKERFEPIMEYLAANGVACITSDLRGHGESIKSPDEVMVTELFLELSKKYNHVYIGGSVSGEEK